MSALILLCRGPLGAEAVGQLRALQADVQQHLLNQYQAVGQQKLAVDAAYIDVVADTTSPMVQLAFIDRRAPSLPEALDACREHRSVRILPLLLPEEPALRRWLHKVVMRWVHASGSQQRIVVSEALAQQVSLAPLLAQAVHTPVADVRAAFAGGTDCAGQGEGNEEGGDWQHDPIAWSSVPDHQRVLLWCTGPRCAAKGALTLWPVLAQTVQRNPVLRKQVLLMQTSCQFPCNHAPLMSVQPDGVWYGGLDADSLPQVLAQHVLQGKVARAWQIHPALHEATLPASSTRA